MKIKALKIILPILPFVILGGCVAVNTASCSYEHHAPVLTRRNATAVIPENYQRDSYSFNVESFYKALDVQYASIGLNNSLVFSAGYTYFVSSIEAVWNGNDVTYGSFRIAQTSQPVDYVLDNFGWSSFAVPWVSVSRVNASGVRRLYYSTSFDLDALVPLTYTYSSEVTITRNVITTGGGGYVSYTIDYSDYSGTPSFTLTPNRTAWNSYLNSFLAGVAVSDSYRDGYNDGYANGNQNGYDDGYSEGRADGIAEGYRDGKADATDELEEANYQAGYQAGIRDASTQNPMQLIFNAVVGVPIDVLNGLQGFAVWNLPLIGVLITMLFLAVILWAVRKVLK